MFDRTRIFRNTTFALNRLFTFRFIFFIAFLILSVCLFWILFTFGLLNDMVVLELYHLFLFFLLFFYNLGSLAFKVILSEISLVLLFILLFRRPAEDLGLNNMRQLNRKTISWQFNFASIVDRNSLCFGLLLDFHIFGGTSDSQLALALWTHLLLFILSFRLLRLGFFLIMTGLVFYFFIVPFY